MSSAAPLRGRALIEQRRAEYEAKKLAASMTTAEAEAEEKKKKNESMSTGYLRIDPLMKSSSNQKSSNKKKAMSSAPEKGFGAVHVRGAHFEEDGTLGYVAPLRTVSYSFWQFMPADNGALYSKRLAPLPENMKRAVKSVEDGERFNRCATVEDHREAIEIGLAQLDIIRRAHMSKEDQKAEPHGLHRFIVGDCDNDGFQTGFPAAALAEMSLDAHHHRPTSWKGSAGTRYVVGTKAERVDARVVEFIKHTIPSLGVSDKEIATSREFKVLYEVDVKSGNIPRESVVILNGLGTTNSSIDDDLFAHVHAACGFTRADSLYKVHNVEKRKKELKGQHNTEKFTAAQVDSLDMAFLAYDFQRHFQFKKPPGSEKKDDSDFAGGKPEVEFLRGVHEIDQVDSIPKTGKFGPFDKFVVFVSKFKAQRLITQCVRMKAQREEKVAISEGSGGFRMERKEEERFSIDHSTREGTARREWVQWLVHPLHATHKKEDLFCVMVEEMLKLERARRSQSLGDESIFTKEDARAFIAKFGFLDLGYHHDRPAHNEHGSRYLLKVKAKKDEPGARYGLYFRFPSNELDSDKQTWAKLVHMIDKEVHQEFHQVETRANMIKLSEALDRADASQGLKQVLFSAADHIGPTAPASVYRKYMQSLERFSKEDIAQFMSVLNEVRAGMRVEKAGASDPAAAASSSSPEKKKNKKRNKKSDKPKGAETEDDKKKNAENRHKQLSTLSSVLDELKDHEPLAKERLKTMADHVGPTAPVGAYRNHVETQHDFGEKGKADVIAALLAVRAHLRKPKAPTMEEKKQKDDKRHQQMSKLSSLLDELKGHDDVAKARLKTMADHVGPAAPVSAYKKHIETQHGFADKDKADIMNALLAVRSQLKKPKEPKAETAEEQKKKSEKRHQQLSKLASVLEELKDHDHVAKARLLTMADHVGPVAPESAYRKHIATQHEFGDDGKDKVIAALKAARSKLNAGKDPKDKKQRKKKQKKAKSDK